MKKIFICLCSIFLALTFISCSTCKEKLAIELMGAGDRIHDSFTFANLGVELKYEGNNVYAISGSVEKIENEDVKSEFDIPSDVSYVIAIKLSACGRDVIKDKVSIEVDGVRSYDAEHLNGNDYTFIILEVKKGENVSIKVSWNGEDEMNYIVKFDDNLALN